MKLVRRVHLYSGIFMFPFVLLYGVSGWFFNHPRHLSGDTVVNFTGTEAVDGSFANLTTPAAMAQQVVDSINKQTEESNGPKIVLTDDRSPQYSGFMSFNLRGEDVSHNISLDPMTGSGEVRTTFKKDDEDESEDRNPLKDIRRVEIESNAMTEAKELVPKLIDDLELPPGELANNRRGSSLTFSAEVDGKPTIISYHLGSGGVAALREDAKPDMEVKSFLQRMHLSRTYSPHFNTRTFWAIIVDGMVISMVFRGLSGLIMWWQLKRTRLPGGGFLVASIVCTALLAAGMHDRLTTSAGLRSRRRSEPQRTEQQGKAAKEKAERRGDSKVQKTTSAQ